MEMHGQQFENRLPNSLTAASMLFLRGTVHIAPEQVPV